MLVELSFKNFYSFADKTQISFELGRKPAVSGFDIERSNGKRLNKAIAVIGANGAGKTNLIQPLTFLRWFITNSFVSIKPGGKLPYTPHMLHTAQPSRIMLRFLMEGEEYKYELELSNNLVLRESLHKRTSRAFSYLFVKEKSEEGYHYKQQNFGFTASQAGTLRNNASIIAQAFSHEVKEAQKLTNYFAGIENNLHELGRHHFGHDRLFQAAHFFADKPSYIEQMSQALCDFDLGIARVEVREQERLTESGESVKVYTPYAAHQSDLGDFELPLFLESSGSQSAFVLLMELLPVLKNGGVAVIDEIDDDLHPHMLSYILDWFRFDHTNPKQAQIIFTCHTPEILNILMKHQVYLVEKQAQQSEAWRLDDVEGLRSDDNLYAKYMAGALSAVPSL